MDFTLNEEQQMFKDTCATLADEQLAPNAGAWDQGHTYPTEAVRQMAEIGLMGVAVPDSEGGTGADNLTYAITMEEISRGCASCGVIMSVNNSLFCDPLLKFGTDEQKEKILNPCASGEKLGSFGLTEPMSGSDAQTMQTVAEKRDGRWVLNGSKNFITNGPHADYMIVFAVTHRASEGGKVKHTAFVLPTDRKGVSLAPHDQKMGIKAAHSCTVFFENVELDDSERLGDENGGFKVAMTTLDGGRIGIASQALGIAAGALNKSVEYAKERKAFGKPISKLQAIQFKLSDMATELDAARLLTLRAAVLKDKGVRHSLESAAAKLYASEACTRITHSAIQVHGGYGYTTEYGIERHYRDARITEIYEGTSEIMRLVVANGVLKG